MDHWVRIGRMCRTAVAIVAISGSAVGAAEQENRTGSFVPISVAVPGNR